MIKCWYYFDIMFSDSIPHHWAPNLPNRPHPHEGKYVFWRTINNYSNLLIFSFYYTIICTEYSDQVHRLNHRQNVVWLVSQLHIHVFIRLLHFWAPFHKKIKVDSLASLGRNATLITSMAACYPIKIVFHKTSILEWQAAIAEISDLFITRFHCKARMATWHMFPLWRKFPQFREILIIPG